jgi:hypothetical protein
VYSVGPNGIDEGGRGMWDKTKSGNETFDDVSIRVGK